MGARWRACLVAAVLSAAAMGLHRLGGGLLAAPPGQSWDAATTWYGEVGPAVAVMSVVRLVALVVALWLATAAALHVAAGHGRRLQRLAHALTPVLVRRLINGAVGVTMTLGATVPAVTPVASVAGAQPEQEPSPESEAMATMRPLDDASASRPGTAPAPSAATAPTAGDVQVGASSDSVPTAAAPMTAEAEVYHVAVGSHFWSIAEEVVGDALGREPSDGEVTRYWLELIAANRDRLVVPENPDLLYPHQVLRLPAM